MSNEVLTFPLSNGLCPEPSNSLYFAYTWSHAHRTAGPMKGPREYLGKRAVSGTDLLRNLLIKQPTAERLHIGAALILKQCVHKSHPNDARAERVGMYVNASPDATRRLSYQVKNLEHHNEQTNFAFAHLLIPTGGLPDVVVPPVSASESASLPLGQVVRAETHHDLYVVERGPVEYVQFEELTRQ